MNTSLSVDVQSTAIQPNSDPPTIRVRNADSDNPLYQVFISLTGPDLAFVASATYHLHETFRSPARRVERTLANPTCQLVIWTWGLFEIQVDIEDASGRKHRHRHRLAYDEEFDVAVFDAK